MTSDKALYKPILVRRILLHIQYLPDIGDVVIFIYICLYIDTPVLTRHINGSGLLVATQAARLYFLFTRTIMYAVRQDHSQASPVIFKLLTEIKGQRTFSRPLTISHPHSTLRLDRINPVADSGMGTMQTVAATQWGFQNGMSHYEQLVKERDHLLDQVKSLNQLLIVYREERPRFETLLQSLSPVFQYVYSVCVVKT